MITARIPLAAVAGVLCSLAVFFGLWRLVGGPLDIAPAIPVETINFTRQIFDTPVRPPPARIKPEREPTQVVLDALGIRPPDDPTVVKVRYERPGLFWGRGIGPLGNEGGITMGVDRDVTPLVRVDPVYPPREQYRGTQGWVRVQFDVTRVGTVRNAIVVAAEPRDTFDEAALEAVARWRYNPRIVNGTAVDRVGLQTLFHFTIEGPR